MSLTIQQIITEADILVPNILANSDKVLQLTQFNGDFFNIVKIPKTVRFSATNGQSDYTLSSAVKAKNIDLVQIGVLKYLDQLSDAVSPLQNVFTFDDDTNTLTISPAPYTNGLSGIVRYHRIGTATFTTSDLTAIPELPEEYQWTLIPALSSWIAYTLDDMSKGAYYEQLYRNAWSAAASSYQKEVVT